MENSYWGIAVDLSLVFRAKCDRAAEANAAGPLTGKWADSGMKSVRSLWQDKRGGSALKKRARASVFKP